MPRTATLHGAAPDENATALLIIDLISDYQFDGGRRLARAARRIARPIAQLSRRARTAGVPVVYVNDHRGRWRSDRTELIKRCTQKDSLGRSIIEQLAPDERDYFIFKPKHSGFFATPLAALLEHFGAHDLILTGVTVEQCVLFTAIDAHLRNYRLTVPRACVAGLELRPQALRLIEQVLRADVRHSPHIRFAVERTGQGRR